MAIIIIILFVACTVIGVKIIHMPFFSEEVEYSREWAAFAVVVVFVVLVWGYYDYLCELVKFTQLRARLTVGRSELANDHEPEAKGKQLILVGRTVADEIRLFSAGLHEKWFVGTLVSVIGIIGEIG